MRKRGLSELRQKGKEAKRQSRQRRAQPSLMVGFVRLTRSMYLDYQQDSDPGLFPMNTNNPTSTPTSIPTKIEARLLLLPAIFHSLSQSLEFLQAYSQNTAFLIDKIRKTAQLVSDTLNMKHQQIAQDTNENTLALTNAAVKDSATIRVITVVTILYLPTTFVAVSISSL